jgi:hypothetical protein
MVKQFEDFKTRLKKVSAEEESRAKEALRVYRPTDKQLPFHLSPAPEKILRGGKRAGKTMAVAAEFASAVTHIPLRGPDGHPLPFQYPKRPILAWIIGYDESHIGQTIHRVLFEPGLIRVIRDLTTGEWRVWNPADPADAAREQDSEPAGPLIPPRLIKPNSWGWEKPREHIFNSVELTNGVKICAYPSTAQQPKQGDPVDLIWIDEDVKNAEHVKEWQDRLTTTRGRMLWSVWPHSTNDALVKMHERAERQKHDANPFVHETVLRMSDSPFITDQAKREALDRMATDEERRARDFGEFMFEKVLMYQFNPVLHGISHLNADDPITTYWERHARQFPGDWTRYLAIDPGYSTCVGLVAVVPPEEVFKGYRVIVESEIYLHNADANTFAARCFEVMAGKHFEAFIIDAHAARITPMAGGPTIGEQYSMAFERHRLVSASTGSTFALGSDNIGGRTEKVRSWMLNGDNGPVLRVVLDSTPNTQREFRSYKRRITKDDATDTPVKGNDHAMDALGYLAMFDPQYVLPEDRPRIMPARFRSIMEQERIFEEYQPRESINLGPPRALAS